MDAHELTRLRQKYQDAKGDDIFDPAFKQAAASLFRSATNFGFCCAIRVTVLVRASMRRATVRGFITRLLESYR